MKIGVISDTHGNIDRVVKQLELLDIDFVLHLGDNSEDAIIIENKLNKEVIAVRGNCDLYDRKNPLERIIEIENKKIFMTHGHKYNVKREMETLYYRGKELEVDIVLFGHTHIPYLNKGKNIKIFNPGSTLLPRGNSRASIGVMDFESDRVGIKKIAI